MNPEIVNSVSKSKSTTTTSTTKTPTTKIPTTKTAGTPSSSSLSSEEDHHNNLNRNNYIANRRNSKGAEEVNKKDKDNIDNKKAKTKSAKKMRPHRIHKVVLTGGPCSGKTTAQARLSGFFEKLGWKVFRVPETATLLLQGGVEFEELTEEEVESFQENLLLTLRRIEETFFDLAKTCDKDCLVICDRGCMDPAAYMAKDAWERVLKRNSLKLKDLRDDRYDQVLHLVTAANGAEEHYNVIDNPCRMEGLELARLRDRATGDAWAGHSYFEVIDNSTDFETKLKRVICSVCRSVGICLYDI